MQLCGWIVNEDLWVGAVSDTDYNKKAGYLKEQQKFQECDLVFDDDDATGRKVVFLILYDRGYRAKMAAYLEGKQEVVQPPASKSDERFRGRTTVYAATVAHDRSGNERSVNVCKRSAMIKRGFKLRMNPVRYNAVWRGWAFRANFMYEAVL